jgi:L-ascorbate metabolism protein UlaG (beta-lactamase superfamily)
MRITKYEHACMVVEKHGARIIIDPGNFTAPLPELTGVVAVVITHEHKDHWDAGHLDRILEAEPGIPLLGPSGVAAAADAYEIRVVSPGDEVDAGPFVLRFYGGRHAVIHESIPVVDNIGVMVDGTFAYSGDSFEAPPVAVRTLAVPTGAPWLKIGEAMDYLDAVKPPRAFGVHEAPLSAIGLGMAHARLGNVTRLNGGEYFELEPGESIAV